MPDRWHGDDIPLNRQDGRIHSPLDRFPAPKPANFEALTASQGTPEFQRELDVYQAQLDACGYQGAPVNAPLNR